MIRINRGTVLDMAGTVRVWTQWERAVVKGPSVTTAVGLGISLGNAINPRARAKKGDLAKPREREKIRERITHTTEVKAVPQISFLVSVITVGGMDTGPKIVHPNHPHKKVKGNPKGEPTKWDTKKRGPKKTKQS